MYDWNIICSVSPLIFSYKLYFSSHELTPYTKQFLQIFQKSLYLFSNKELHIQALPHVLQSVHYASSDVTFHTAAIVAIISNIYSIPYHF